MRQSEMLKIQIVKNQFCISVKGYEDERVT